MRIKSPSGGQSKAESLFRPGPRQLTRVDRDKADRQAEAKHIDDKTARLKALRQAKEAADAAAAKEMVPKKRKPASS